MFNADLAAGARVAIVVSCFPLFPPPPPAGADTDLNRREPAAITEAGGALETIEPGPDFLRLSGHGSRLLDASLAAEAGRRQARDEAARLGSWMRR